MVKDIINRLWECISSSTEYSFEKDPLPVFYVLYANYQQANLFDVNVFTTSIMNSPDKGSEKEVDILGLFTDMADDSINDHKELFKQFNSYIRTEYNICRDNDNCRYDYHTYKYHFKDIVEFFIDKYVSLAKVSRPVDLKGFNDVTLSCLCLLSEDRYVFEYGSSYGDMAIESENPFINRYAGSEVDKTMYLISQVRLIAHDLSPFCIVNEGLLYDKGWVFYSFRGFDETNIIDSLENFCDDDYMYGVLVLPMDFCYSQKYRQYREYIAENKMLETIIYLPKGTFTSYNKESVILFLSKDGRDQNFIHYPDYMPSYFTLIDGRKILKNGQVDFSGITSIMTDELWNMNPEKDLRISDNPRVWRHIPKNEETLQLCMDNMLPSSWFNYMDRLDHKDSYVEYSVDQLVSKSKEVVDKIPSKGVVLTDDNFSYVNYSDSYLPSTLKTLPIPSDYLGYRGESIVFEKCEDGIRFCIVQTDDVFFTSKDNVVLSKNSDISLNWEYICKTLVNSPKIYSHLFIEDIDAFYYDTLMMMSESNGFTELDTKVQEWVKNMLETEDVKEAIQLLPNLWLNPFLSSKLCILKNVDLQEGHLRMLHQEQQALKKQEVEDRKREAAKEASSDIAHMMGLSFQEILACANSFKKIPEKRAEAEAIVSNIKYMQRILTTIGTDISRYNLNRKPLSVNRFFREYLDSWKRMGRAIYDIEFNSDIMDDVEVDMDESLMMIMMDAILENARRHGFHKVDKEDNRVIISISASEDAKGIVIKVKNNGAPLPADFTLNRFITRGESMGNSGNTGVGGYHIYHIVRQHGGVLDVYPDGQNQTVVKVYIPFN